MHQEIITGPAHAVFSNSLLVYSIAAHISKHHFFLLPCTTSASSTPMSPKLWSSWCISSYNRVNRLLDVLESAVANPHSVCADYPRLIRELVITMEPGQSVQAEQLARLSRC